MKNPVMNVVRSKQTAAQTMSMKTLDSAQILRTAVLSEKMLISWPEKFDETGRKVAGKIGIGQNDFELPERN